MDLDSAIKAHVMWKMKLANYLKTPDGSLKAAEVSLDNKCDLGKWIHSDQSIQKFPEYVKLKADHAKFHAVASAIIVKADSGQKVSEEVALGSKSEFDLISTQVVNSIMQMKIRLAKQVA